MASIEAARQDRIVDSSGEGPGVAIVRGTCVSVEAILERLAEEPDIVRLLDEYPELSRADVSAVMAYALDRVKRRERTAPRSLETFYDEVARRPDIASILRRLAG